MKSCEYKLKQGIRRSWIPQSGKYEICISRSQHERLFGPCTGASRIVGDTRTSCEPPRPIGCGVYACAYAHRDPDKVVKITRDPADVASLLKGQQIEEHVVKTFGVHKLESATRFLRQPGAAGTAYAVEAERLAPLPKKWYRRVHCMSFRVGSWPTWYKPTKDDVRRILACCPKSETKDEQRVCRRVLNDITRAKLKLAAAGVNWRDIHAGNIGVNAQGRWKALDLGYNRASLIENVPSLHGARRR